MVFVSITWPVYCTSIGEVIRILSIISKIKIKFINNKWRKLKLQLGFLWDIFVFRFYLPKMIWLDLLLLYKIVYTWIFVEIWHGSISISRDRNIRYNFHGSWLIKSWIDQLSANTPFHFSFTVPLIGFGLKLA